MLQVGVTPHAFDDTGSPYGYGNGGKGIRNAHHLNWVEGRTHFAAVS